MRVLVVTNDFPPRRGGIESFVYTLCTGLEPDEVVVYTAAMPGASDIDQRLGFPVIRDRAATLLPTSRVGRSVAAVARDYGCTGVVFGAAAPLGLLAGQLRTAGVRRMVAVTHGHEVWWAKTPGARALLRRIGEHVDAMTYVSEHCRRAIAPALSASARAAMRRLSPAVHVERFRPGLDGSVMRRCWRSGDRLVVLAASRLVARKGHDVLIRAWEQVNRRHPDAQLVIVGDGPRRALLRSLVRSLGLESVVVMVPSVAWEKMPLVYAAADVFALPCRTRLGGLEPEALGIVFLEAAASGLPVVVGRSGGAVETVVDGRSGYVVEPRSVDKVAAAVTSLLDDKTRSRAMGAYGRAMVRESFTTSAAQTLRELLDGGERHS